MDVLFFTILNSVISSLREKHLLKSIFRVVYLSLSLSTKDTSIPSITSRTK